MRFVYNVVRVFFIYLYQWKSRHRFQLELFFRCCIDMRLFVAAAAASFSLLLLF